MTLSNLRVPPFNVPGLSRFLSEMVQYSDRLHNEAISKASANDSVMLQSPAGKVFEVRVDDAGMLFTTLVLDVAP